MARMHNPLTIGDLSHRSGVAASALRYYEELGLISSTRTGGNQRRYSRHVLRRLAFIRAAQRVGLSLDEIHAALATLPDQRTPTKADWTKVSRAWTDRIDEQIRALGELRSRVTSCVGCGCLSLRTCALSNPDDVLGESHTGPTWLATDEEPKIG